MKPKKKTKPQFVPSASIKRRISNWEGTAMHGPTIDPLSGKVVGANKSFEAEADSFIRALPTDIRSLVLSNPDLADHLYSYSYNVGAGNFKKRVVPVLQSYYKGESSIHDIQQSMWASGDKKLRGLARRRAEERAGVERALSDANPSMSRVPFENENYNYYRANQLGYTPRKNGHMDSRDYVTGMYLKSPTHPTVIKAIVGDLGEGYNPYYNSQDGQLYSQTWMKPVLIPTDTNTDYSLSNSPLENPATGRINAWTGAGSPAYGGYDLRLPSFDEFMRSISTLTPITR